MGTGRGVAYRRFHTAFLMPTLFLAQPLSSVANFPPPSHSSADTHTVSQAFDYNLDATRLGSAADRSKGLLLLLFVAPLDKVA